MSDTPAPFLDTKGLQCPLPILKTRKALKSLAPGEVLTVEATDPSAVDDMKAFCVATGHELMSSTNVDGVFIFEIKKSE